MEIYINDEKIPFELDNEVNCLEIVKEIEKYISDQEPKQFFESIFIDKKEYSAFDEENLRKLLIDDIGKIEFNTSDIVEMAFNSVVQINAFLDILKNIFNSKKWYKLLKELGDAFAWVKDGINQIYRLFGNANPKLKEKNEIFLTHYNNLKEHLDSVLTKKINYDKQLYNKIIEEIDFLVQVIEDVQIILNGYKLLDPNLTLKQINFILTDMDNESPKLEKVPLLFQTGKDSEAMDIIQELSNILETSIKLFFQLRDTLHIDLKDYYDNDNDDVNNYEGLFSAVDSNLQELMSAIENNDSVMIGDLLEYEFLPAINTMKHILLKIKNDVFLNSN